MRRTNPVKGAVIEAPKNTAAPMKNEGGDARSRPYLAPQEASDNSESCAESEAGCECRAPSTRADRREGCWSLRKENEGGACQGESSEPCSLELGSGAGLVVFER